ncbi:MAG: cell envelope integrity protein CreD [Alphaproteobacteria bacterium]
MRAWMEAFLNEQGGALKLALIGVLTLTLLIPLGLVGGVVDERSWRHQEVLQEIARQHGAEQRLVGPFVVVPYVRRTVRHGTNAVDGKPEERSVESELVAVILPTALSMRATLTHEVRRRGVYTAPVYGADVSINGAFNRPDLSKTIPNLVSVDWEKAAIVLGISDLAGLSRAGEIVIGGEAQAFQAGAPAFASGLFIGGEGRKARQSGDHGRFGVIHTPMTFQGVGTEALTFVTTVRLNGSGGMFMTPLAGTSRFEMQGDWPHPSFQGAPLPEARSVTDTGFTASWTVPGLARGYGAIWYGSSVERLLTEAGNGGIGFRHARPDAFYNAAARSVKYGVLFVTLTFLACFVLERFGGRQLHTAQYGLVGLSLALFYLLLIALAEHIGLFWAYLLAASVIAGMNAAYIGAALASWRRGFGAATALALLYGAFYVMLESEDNALLIGAGLLLIGLAMGMAATVRMGAAKAKA